MLYLIAQLSVWLLLTALFAALAAWALNAQRTAPAQAALRATRERLLRDLAQLAAGERPSEGETIVADDSLARIRESRITEVEHALEAARSRADEAVAEATELRRRLDQTNVDSEELTRLRALAVSQEPPREHTIEAAEIEEPQQPEEDVALQAWRLRYFERRVQYLESQARAPAAPPAPETPQQVEAPPMAEWRAREAEARAAYLESQVRALAAPVAEPVVADTDAFAANAEVDVLLRWRLLYLERRVAHLQVQAAEAAADTPAPAPAHDAAPDPDRWKWRARYLEARVRHLEQRPAVAPAPMRAAALVADAPSAPVETTPPARSPAPTRRGVKPLVLASARAGAPDDLTLIENISRMQQTTLNALGVFHFDQIAAWSPENVAWVDQYFRLGGRIEDEDWVEQAADLAREGPAAARRALADERV